MRTFNCLACAAILATANAGGPAMAADASNAVPEQAGTAQRRREGTEWCNIVWPQATRADLPRVLLIGDSIAMHYEAEVTQRLKGKAYVARIATSKALSDPAFLKELDYVLGEFTYAVIHFNNGLHDGGGQTTAEYAAAIPKVMNFIRDKGKGAKLIWASTTPIRGDNAATLEKNRAAAEAATARKLPIDDLYGLMSPHPEWLSRDNIHPAAEGSRALGAQVARYILEALEH
jgi:hypothetical protein